MGIFLQKRDPVARDPDILIQPSFTTASGTSNRLGPCVVPQTVDVCLDDPSAPPPKGSIVYIFEGSGGMDACVAGPLPRRIGMVVDDETLEVTEACRDLGTGLKGVVLGPPMGDGLVRVGITWDE